MTASTCHAADFLRCRGPARIPLRACCAAAVIRSRTAYPPGTDLSSAPFVCAATGSTIPSIPSIPPDGRPAGDPADLSVPSSVRLAGDPAAAGVAEQIS
jgi:hypothetical protein